MDDLIREREIDVLEFSEIRQRLAALTATPMAREEAMRLLPSADLKVVERRLKETGDGRLLAAHGAFAPPAVQDIEPLAGRAAKGGALKGAELASIAQFLKGVDRWRRFFKPVEKKELYPLLANIVAGLDGCAALGSLLEKSIDPDGEVLDQASTLLSSLRRRRRGLEDKIREKLDAYLRDTSFRRYLQENLVTIRGGRYVLPVKQEHRGRVEGVLHDQSASGATLFIEPLPVVRLQNDLAALQNEIEREIERILYTISGEVASFSTALLGDREIYATLDLIVARGRLSLEQKGTEPRITVATEHGLHLDRARHPLLAGAAVPLSVSMGGDDRRVLVITGPNTGGKTVALKTIGLMAIMAQSGLHIPAGEETSLCLFDRIRADIGDEQSIAQSLSTFSAHFKNIIEILGEAGGKSLVLFDELGAGTDPSEGAALAMAILAELVGRGSLAVATTHINELKLFAQVRRGMENAAMEFDTGTLEPTYRMLQGVPGQSNAFFIAGKLGLPEHVLKKGRGFLRREHAQVEAVIASLVEDRQRLSDDSRQAASDRARAGLLAGELEREREKLNEQREEILARAREEARHLVRRAKHTVDELIRDLRQLRIDSASGDAIAGAEAIRREIHRLRDEQDADKTPVETQTAAGDLCPGQTVLVGSLRQKGDIISVEGDEALIQLGSMRAHVPLNDLQVCRAGDPADAPAIGSGVRSVTVQKDLDIKTELNLRGLTVEEAVPAIEKFLDDALWAGLTRVTVIHGKGTGKLKEGLRAYLRGHHLVREQRPGAPGEGGEGVTVVTLNA